jgi:hypothetical protein
MSPKVWVRYWLVGWIFGPALALYGIIESDVQMIALGLLILFLAISMTAFWRKRAATDLSPSGSDSN